MEKKSEYERFFEEVFRIGLSFDVKEEIKKFLRDFKKLKRECEMAPNQASQFLLYDRLEDAEKDFNSFCVYYGMDEYDINQIIKEV